MILHIVYGLHVPNNNKMFVNYKLLWESDVYIEMLKLSQMWLTAALIIVIFLTMDL